MLGTDRSPRGGGWRRLEEINQKTYIQMCIAHGHRQLCGEGLRWGRAWVESSIEVENEEHLKYCQQLKKKEKFCGHILEIAP